MSETNAVSYTLGLDLGSASIGWAIIKLNSYNHPSGLLKAGVRIFEPGVEGSALDIQQGKDQSRAVERRTARLQRRQLRRRTARQRELFFLLQKHGMLPRAADSSANASAQRHQVLNDVDHQLIEQLLPQLEADVAARFSLHELLPYYLRKCALDRQLSPLELGRALYHLSQRRGFRSNRREGKKKNGDEDKGKVLSDISALEAEIRAADARTLGEFFAGLDPHQRKVRRRWTARKMFAEEFEKIWSRQQPFSPAVLTDELKGEIARLLFFQRPIAAQEHLVGFCELEPAERRAPWAYLEAQQFRLLQKLNDLQFRLLQKLNDLKVVAAGGLTERSLTPDERQAILLKLENEGDQKFTALRKTLGLKSTEFNLERGGEKTLRGNRTNAFMRSIFGMFWDEMPVEEKHNAVTLWYRTESKEELASRAQQLWALDESKAVEFASREPEDGYCSLSLKAILRLLPEMEKGSSYGTIRPRLYPEKRGDPKPLLPLVREAVPSLRNPAVERAVTEMRKVVNAIVRKYGKPYEIRIEMARELRKSRKQREETSRRMRLIENQRKGAKARLDDCGIQNPSRIDIEKVLLFEECGGICPYTGKPIQFSSLFGQEPQFDIEHIIPLSRCPDDSFNNKTLCYNEENRSVKRGRTPWEAYGNDDERWMEILERVKKFNHRAKLTRFQLRSETELDQFTARQMNDTRYTTRLAMDLLKTLYGGSTVGQEDGSSRQVVFATTGMATSTLRKSWGLEAILREALPSANGQNRGKPRTDHRHHAIDAIVIALTSQAAVQRMSVAAANAPSWRQDSRVFRATPAPWPDFVDSIRPHITEMLISHRPEHKMSGGLHKQTNYGRSRGFDKKGMPVIHQRELLSELSSADVKNIVDPTVRRAVEEQLAVVGTPANFSDEKNNWPFLTWRDGRKVVIRRVRVKRAKHTQSIGQGERQRFIEPGNIHHVALFVTRDKRGKDQWTSNIVSLLDATLLYREQCKRTRTKGFSIVQHNHPDDPEAEFLFSLMKNDTVEIEVDGKRCIYLVTSFESDGRINMVPINAAGKRDEQKGTGMVIREGPNVLRKRTPRKVVIDLLGTVHPAND